MSCCRQKLVAEAGDSSGAQGRETSAIGCRYQATSSEDSNRLRRAIAIVEVCTTVTALSLLVVIRVRYLQSSIQNPSVATKFGDIMFSQSSENCVIHETFCQETQTAGRPLL